MLGRKNSSDSVYICQRAVEMLAKYDFKWTDGILEPKFSRYRWKSQKDGRVTYIGDKIKLQNGFGAWQNIIYECDYDPAIKKVTDVRGAPGRIPVN